jgi:MoaA/NifB/PqqE/SkfB family radical SAM enzyme
MTPSSLDDAFARLPVPRPDPEAYERNLGLALARSPLVRENYERLQRASRDDAVEHLPTKLDFENVSRCNFRCAMCQVSHWDSGRRAADMRFEDFARIIDELGTLVEIKLQGVGEPLLGGDAYFRMIRYARQHHIWVRTTTNASLLHLRDYARQLVDSGVNEVQVSLDGASREVFETIREGGNFAVVTSNCALLNGLCNERNLLLTRMWVVVQQLNLAEMTSLVELGSRLGFRRITFALDLHGWGQDHVAAANQDLTVSDGEVLSQAFEALERGRQLGVEVSYWRNNTKYDVTQPSRLCPWPFERAFVSSDLRIVPCCMIGNPEVIDLGSALDFATTWNSEPYRAFRRAHLEGKLPGACKGCYESVCNKITG